MSEDNKEVKEESKKATAKKAAAKKPVSKDVILSRVNWPADSEGKTREFKEALKSLNNVSSEKSKEVVIATMEMAIEWFSNRVDTNIVAAKEKMKKDLAANERQRKIAESAEQAVLDNKIKRAQATLDGLVARKVN